MYKSLTVVLAAMLVYPVYGSPLHARSQDASITPATEMGKDLDLSAVLQLFTESDSPEAFERALNSEENGVNNVDIDHDGEVDYIRVMEYAEGETHVFVLQVPNAEDTFLDLATIEVEKQDGDEVALQAIGDEDVYGENYYVELNTPVHVTSFHILGPLFAPRYRVWRSTAVWHVHPVWFRAWHPVVRATYLTRHRLAWRATRRVTVRRARRATRTYRRRRRRRGS
jgi:hypothetical protein